MHRPDCGNGFAALGKPGNKVMTASRSLKWQTMPRNRQETVP
jgi:hypothetical protein